MFCYDVMFMNYDLFDKDLHLPNCVLILKFDIWSPQSLPIRYQRHTLDTFLATGIERVHLYYSLSN